MHKLLYIAIGGGAGAVLRYLVSGWGQRALGGAGFPAGTLLVNVLGGFTTFSTFAFETLSLADDGERGRALANVLLSNAGCLAAVWLGYRLAQRYYGT